MKKPIRIPALLLAGVFLLGMGSCKGDSGDSPTTTGKTEGSGPDRTTAVEVMPDIPEGLDFSGTEFRMIARNASNYYADELWVADSGKTDVDSKVYGRYKSIEETYGVSFKLDTKTTEVDIDPWMNVNSLVAGPEDTYHLVATHGRSCANYAVKGLASDWNRLRYVNLNAGWWSQDAQKQWTALSGSIYMMTGDISYLSVGQAVGQFFNKNLLRNAGLEFPYQLVRDHNWTYENFEQYVRQLNSSLNGDNSGNIKTDSTGYATGWWRGPMNIIYSTGGRWLNVTEDDITVVGVNDHNLTNAFDRYFDFLKLNGIMIGGDYGNAQQAFTENRVGFYDEITLRAAEFKRVDTGFFGLVPMPKYDTTVDRNYTFVNAAINTFTVPACVLKDRETAEMTSVILELMAFYGCRDVLPTYYREMLTVGSMTDVDSVEMMEIIRNSLTYDLGYYYNINGFCDIGQLIASDLAGGTVSQFSTKYASLIDKVSKPLSEWKSLD
mgnify:CR=1 FL=1